MTIQIPLSKQGKHKGQFVAIVDDCDSNLADVNWFVKISNNTQYATNKGKTTRYLHREVLGRVIGRPLEKGEYVDHINGDGLDNRRENLRLATHKQNLANQRKQSRNTSSQYKGVAYYKRDNNWEAHIKKDGKKMFLGRYPTEHEAHLAYVKASRELFGEFANGG